MQGGGGNTPSQFDTELRRIGEGRYASKLIATFMQTFIGHTAHAGGIMLRFSPCLSMHSSLRFWLYLLIRCSLRFAYASTFAQLVFPGDAFYLSNESKVSIEDDSVA